jgi:hypothetical protein
MALGDGLDQRPVRTIGIFDVPGGRDGNRLAPQSGPCTGRCGGAAAWGHGRCHR